MGLQNSPMRVVRNMTVTTTMTAMKTMHEIMRASLNERAFQHLPTLYSSPSCGCKYMEMHMWQSRIEIEYYSVVYFKRITKFDAL